jgi:oligopeptide transport system permease protein
MTAVTAALGRVRISTWIAVCVVGVMALAACFASWVAPFSFEYQDIDRVLLAPNALNWFGTDQLGRDLFSRIIYGARLSLAVSVVAAMFSLIVGGIYGAISGWLGGLTDRILMRAIDVFQAIPSLILLILVSAVIDAVDFFSNPTIRSLVAIFLSLSVVGWVSLARLVRAQVLQIKSANFVEGARAIGASEIMIVLRHISPNIAGPVVAMLALQIPSNILFESFLSFLGLGFQPPLSSWGVLAADGWHARTDPHLILFPGLAIFVTTLAFNILGDSLRDYFDRRHRK